MILAFERGPVEPHYYVCLSLLTLGFHLLRHFWRRFDFRNFRSGRLAPFHSTEFFFHRRKHFFLTHVSCDRNDHVLRASVFPVEFTQVVSVEFAYSLRSTERIIFVGMFAVQGSQKQVHGCSEQVITLPVNLSEYLSSRTLNLLRVERGVKQDIWKNVHRLTEIITEGFNSDSEAVFAGKALHLTGYGFDLLGYLGSASRFRSPCQHTGYKVGYAVC